MKGYYSLIMAIFVCFLFGCKTRALFTPQAYTAAPEKIDIPEAGQYDLAWSRAVSQDEAERMFTKTLSPNLSYQDIEQRLKERGITFNPQAKNFFDRSMLLFLMRFFTFSNINGPFHMDVIAHDSLRLANLHGNTLYFAPNAGVNLYTRRVQELTDGLKSRGTLQGDQIEISLQFNNELYLALVGLFYNKTKIEQLLYYQFGIAFDPRHFPYLRGRLKAFSKRELLIILKQLLGLPAQVSSFMALSNLLRLNIGVKVRPEDKGTLVKYYDPQNRTMFSTDVSFYNPQIAKTSADDEEKSKEIALGADKMQHLFGLAHLQPQPPRIKEPFFNMSWESVGRGRPRVIPGSVFITDLDGSNS